MRSLGGLVVIGLLLVGMACSEPNTDPTGRTWQLTTLNGIPPHEGSLIDLTLQSDSVSGSSGCNSYSGPAAFGDGSITLGPEFAVTFMMCEEATMEQEAAYLRALGQASSYVVESDELLLRDENGITVAVFE